VTQAPTKEIKQLRPSAVLCKETTLSILRTADGIQRRLCEVMEPFGITAQQYNVLRIVRGAGEAGIPSTSIAEKMIEQSPGLTRLLDRLEEKKLVTRVRSTKAAATLLEQMEEPVREVEQALMAAMTTKKLTTLTELLTDVRKSF
jgi:DNA-binding MarR family transcriptional regulator